MPMPMRRALTVAACLLPLTVASPAFAYFDNFIHNTVVGSMNKAEAASFAKAVLKVLTDGEDGAPSAGAPPRAVAARPSRPASRRCVRRPTRPVVPPPLAELTRGSSHDEWTGWFCKQADGRWKSRKVGDD